MGTTFTVSNASELQAAIDAAQGGDRIELEAGNYGELNLSNEVFDGAGVTFTSADPDNMAVFEKIVVYRSENIHFDTVEVDFEPTGNTGYLAGFRAADSSNVSISNSLLHGGFDESRTGDDADAPVGAGVQLFRVSDIVVENNEIYDFHVGVVPAYVDGLDIIDNYIHDIRTSPVTGGGVSDVEVSGNHFSSSAPVNLGGTGDHGDMIHFYPLTNQVGPMENILIRDNFFEQGTNESPILGIYIDDAGGGGSGLGYSNVVIDNNIIHNGDAQGLRVENVDGLTVTNNSFIQSSGEGLGEAPGIVLTSGTQNVVIDNNIIAGLVSGSSISDGAGAQFNVQIGDNIFIQNSDPFGDNYAGDIFLNGLTADGDIVDFTPLEGSVAEGYGSTLANYFAQPGDHAAVITDTHGDGLDMRTVHFDAEALFSAYHEVDLNGAELAWDFGDGNTGGGNNISHTYDTAGSYDVTATFTLQNGRVISVEHTVDVFSPDAVTLDFEDGALADVSDVENDVEAVGAYTLESSRFGDALRLTEDSSRVAVDRSEEILDNPEFTISFAFQKDGGSGSNDDNGLFSYFSGVSYISTGEGTIRVSGATSTGDSISLSGDVPQIEDGEWHHLTYTFSSETGMAVMYLDGEEVDRVEGVTGIQSATRGHDLLLGGRVSGSFGGLLDEFEFTRVALTADEVSTRYDGLFNPSSNPDVGDVRPNPDDGNGVPDTGDEPDSGSGGTPTTEDPREEYPEPDPVDTECDLTTGTKEDMDAGGVTPTPEADGDPMSGPGEMPTPVDNHSPDPEPEEEEVDVTLTPRPDRSDEAASPRSDRVDDTPAGEEDATIYDAILESITARSLMRSEEGESMTAPEPEPDQESYESARLFRLFDILRDTGKIDDAMPPAADAEDDAHEEDDTFSLWL